MTSLRTREGPSCVNDAKVGRTAPLLNDKYEVKTSGLLGRYMETEEMRVKSSKCSELKLG